MPAAKGQDALAQITELLGGLRVHDASPAIADDTEMWFMHEGPQVTTVFQHAEHGAATNRVSLSEHTGTHVDAPFHFDPHGATIDEVEPDALLLRPYRKLDLSPLDLSPGDLVGADALQAAGELPGRGEVAVVEFGWDRYLPGGADAKEPGWWGRNEPGLDESACQLLVDAGVAAVASDTAACDVAARDGEVLSGHGHAFAFLPNAILIVEGLRGLAEVPQTGLFVGLPLKIARGTGSPMRVLLLYP
ncbi:MAG TPA: cyclase family protein [Solirubrobacteraceae bacterium]|nr:cyclase family protein [Solirubrobacteraceae bacterium]